MLFSVWADGIEAFPRQSCRRRPSRERRRAEAEKSRIFRCQRNPHVLDQRGKGWFLYLKSCQILLHFFCPLTAGGVQTTNPIGGEAKTGAWSAFKLHSQRNRKVLISTHRRPNQSFERGKLTAFWTIPSVFLKFPDDDFDDESDASRVSILECYLCWQFEAFVWGVLIFLVVIALFENLGGKFNLRYFLNRVPLNWP